MNADSNSVPMRREFGASQEMREVETASSAVAAQAKAMIESRYIMAIRNPRNWDQVRQDLLRECHRPAFAHNKSAYYNKPIGKGVEGLGIRFVEVALRCMKNVLAETSMIFEDESKEVHRVSVTDLEANITYPLDVRVSKTVERSKPMDDGSYISVRKNSYNKEVYTITANDDDLLNKRAALISKAIRTLGLRIIPGDLQDEAEAIIKQVRLDKAAEDPGAEKKAIADAFGDLGVKASELAEYIGHSIETCSPHELVQLRGLYGAIRDGEATWKEAMDNKKQNASGGEAKTYPQDQFDANLQKWSKLILSGKKNAEQIIVMAGSKAALTAEQQGKLRALKPPTTASKEQLAALRLAAEEAAISEADILKHFKIDTLDVVDSELADAILAFIANPTGE